MKRLRLHPDFDDAIARHNIGMNQMSALAGLSYANLYKLKNPDTQPNHKGTMHRTTAWKVVNAFAEKTGMPPEQAWPLLIVETEEPPIRRPRRKAAEAQ